jgi:hypothetical protein
MPRFLTSPITWIVVVLLVLASGGVYWQIDRQQAREREERERIADEQSALRRAAELEARRLREQKRFQEDIQIQKEAEEKQRQMDADFRQDELKQKRFTADERATPSPQSSWQSMADERSRREAERRQQYEDEESVQRARAEVERQRRGLEQREYEEQMVRARREAAARDSSPSSAPSAAAPSTPAAPPPIIIRPPAPKK